ncbi:semaphorin-6A-like [Rhineura floridana]|uniref:semaphorin-6A-like n=1 Tax=Rhineura floridana TaxID=261503 RepID=UPI002AC7F3F1|nr:semaphorin-6A-like [Rhineura floridana]
MKAEVVLLYFTLSHFGRAAFPFEPSPITVVEEKYTKIYPVYVGVTERDIISIHQLLILDRSLYIGTSEHILHIDLDKSFTDYMTDRKSAVWRSSEADEEACKIKGRPELECRNFIKVLLKRNDDTLFACGTNAYNPICRHYKVDTLEPEGDDIKGAGRCPYDRKDNNVALFADDNLYSATVRDFFRKDILIYRSLGDKPKLRTVWADSRWLKEPSFVHAINYGIYIYFFFQEVSVEYYGVEKIVVSRVARVCKNDMGGNIAMLEKEWTSFLKARLVCAVPGDTPFHFNILSSVTDVFRLGDQDIVLTTFTTPKNSIPGSAICAFRMDDIDKAFAGRFKEQKSAVSIWTTVPDYEVPTPRPGSCAGSESFVDYASSNDLPANVLKFLRTHVLMAESVEPIGHKPWFTMTVATRDTMVKIAVDNTAGPNGDHTVVFIGSENGWVLKFLVQSNGNGFLERSIFLEMMNIYNYERCRYNGDMGIKRVTDLQIDKKGGALYVAFTHCVIKVPLGSCERHGPCKKACIASRDPYCGWANEACIHLSPGISVGYEQDVENGDTDGLDDC